MESLFINGHEYSEEARNLNKDIIESIGPILKKYVEKGFFPREIENVVISSVFESCLNMNLDYKIRG